MANLSHTEANHCIDRKQGTKSRADSPNLLAAAEHWLECLAACLPPPTPLAFGSLAQRAPGHARPDSVMVLPQGYWSMTNTSKKTTATG